jgi:hypothetical protein
MLNYDPHAEAGYSEQEWTVSWENENHSESALLLSTILRRKEKGKCISRRHSGTSLPARTEFPPEYISGFCAAG